MVEQAKFKYAPLGKTLEKQTEKEVDALKSLNLSSKTNELKEIDGTFSKNLLNDLIIYKLKEIIQLQDIIKPNELGYTSKRVKTYNFSKYTLPIGFQEIYTKKN